MTATVTLNCDHTININVPNHIPFEFDPSHAWTCLECFRWHSFEGVRHVKHVAW